jgi:hypothetical protein
MKVVYLQVNQCYAVLFGDSLTSVDGQYFFQSLEDLRWTLKKVGLKLEGSQVVCA